MWGCQWGVRWYMLSSQGPWTSIRAAPGHLLSPRLKTVAALQFGRTMCPAHPKDTFQETFCLGGTHTFQVRSIILHKSNCKWGPPLGVRAALLIPDQEQSPELKTVAHCPNATYACMWTHTPAHTHTHMGTHTLHMRKLELSPYQIP